MAVRLNSQIAKVVLMVALLLVSLQGFVWHRLLQSHHDQGHEHPMLAGARGLSSRRETIIGSQEDVRENNNNQQQQQSRNRLPDERRLHRRRQPSIEKQKLSLNIHPPKVATARTVSPYLKHPLFEGKERLLTILHEAHFFNDSAAEFFQDDARVEALAKQLPSWETVTNRLGGESPVIEGLETCETYQKLVPPIDRFLGVAGLFATGTNLLASLLVANCQNDERIRAGLGAGVRWQVNWGKHSPARYRMENKIDQKLKNEIFLPVVSIRHPYSWMQSLCRQRYSTHWFHNAKEHCPNLVPNDIDRKWFKFVQKYGKRGVKSLYNDPWLSDNLLDTANFTLDSEVVPVRVRYKSGTLYHDSLPDMYNSWYHEYLDADFPRLVVRLEDLVFHAKEVVTKVCTCMGGSVRDDFNYITETAKVGDEHIHGKQEDRTNMIKTFTKWHAENRTKNMTSEDVAYAKESLDADLLKMFQYSHPSKENP
ncbi:expressed unknown protein [Seminavis robusta]|uniref:Uncharacterized protein n=1 Tax=Seminavis robusta TaxID=568900 RepID=A0A9N8HK40_9STRA|nr:expressed unknown protein [Seminavis robusta]|eukprot:Sro809_g205580.1 n/a (481) ;mRNA; r:25232-26674